MLSANCQRTPVPQPTAQSRFPKNLFRVARFSPANQWRNRTCGVHHQALVGHLNLRTPAGITPRFWIHRTRKCQAPYWRFREAPKPKHRQNESAVLLSSQRNWKKRCRIRLGDQGLAALFSFRINFVRQRQRQKCHSRTGLASTMPCSSANELMRW